MNSEINPYEIIKDTIFKVFSFRYQNTIFLLLFFIYVFQMAFPPEFLIIKNYCLNLIPDYVKNSLELLAIPIMDFLFMIGFLGIIFMILMIVFLL